MAISMKQLIAETHTMTRRHWGKIALAALAMWLISYIGMICLVIVFVIGAIPPILMGLFNSHPAIPALIYIIVWYSAFLIAVIALAKMLSFGFSSLLLVLYRKRKAELDHLFDAFRDASRSFVLALLLGLMYFAVILIAAIFLVILLFAVFAVYSGIAHYSDILHSQRPAGIIGIAVFVFLAVTIPLIVLHIRCGFAWFYLYDNPHMTAMQALRKSMLVTKKRSGQIFSACVKVSYLYIIASLVLSVIPLYSIVTDVIDTAIVRASMDRTVFLTNIIASLLSGIAGIKIQAFFTVLYENILCITQSGPLLLPYTGNNSLERTSDSSDDVSADNL